jgi:hypothetical protein
MIMRFVLLFNLAVWIIVAIAFARVEVETDKRDKTEPHTARLDYLKTPKFASYVLHF